MFANSMTVVAALDWPRLTIVIAVGGILLICVGFFFLLLVIALWEKNYIRPLVPVRPDEVPAVGSDVIEMARACGFLSIGSFADGDSGWKRGIITLAHSVDHRIIAWVLHQRVGGRHRLMTRLNDRRWLVTSSVTGITDFSGMIDEEMLPDVPFDVLLFYHRQRLTPYGPNSMAISPGRITSELHELHAERVAKMVVAGLLKYVYVDRSTYRYSLRAAIRMVFDNLRSMTQLTQRIELAKRKREEFASIASRMPHEHQTWKQEGGRGL